MFFSKTYPSILTVKEGVFLPLRLSCKESSTFLTKPLFPQGREDVTALRCSEPLRSKVGGPSKVFAILCGMGPPEDEDYSYKKTQSGIVTFICYHLHFNDSQKISIYLCIIALSIVYIQLKQIL